MPNGSACPFVCLLQLVYRYDHEAGRSGSGELDVLIHQLKAMAPKKRITSKSTVEEAPAKAKQAPAKAKQAPAKAKQAPAKAAQPRSVEELGHLGLIDVLWFVDDRHDVGGAQGRTRCYQSLWGEKTMKTIEAGHFVLPES